MKFILSLIVLMVYSIDCQISPNKFSCASYGRFLLASFENILELSVCEKLCQSQNECQAYTFYDQSNPGLPNSCYLFTSCPDKNFNCKGCFTASRQPKATCSLPPSVGGKWFCGNRTDPSHPGDFDQCFYICGSTVIPSICLAGYWDVENSEIRCPCNTPPTGEDLLCNNAGHEIYEGETVCTKKCPEGEEYSTTCKNGLWTNDLSMVCKKDSSPSNKLHIVWWAGLGAVGGLSILTTIVTIYIILTRRRRTRSDPVKEMPSKHVREMSPDPTNRVQIHHDHGFQKPREAKYMRDNVYQSEGQGRLPYSWQLQPEENSSSIYQQLQHVRVPNGVGKRNYVW